MTHQVKPPRGGARSGSGGTVRRPILSTRQAKRLRALLTLGGGAYSQQAVEQWIEAQIDAAWAEVDAELQAAEARAWEGEVL